MEKEDYFMEYKMHKNYKTLAELKMQKPTLGRLNNWVGDLAELVNFHEKVEMSLIGDEFDPLEKYAEKFRHFVHLFFADEKLELESKFKENIQVKFIGHRSASKGKKAKYFAIYSFMLTGQNTEDLVLYQTISIDGVRGKITHIHRSTNYIEVAFEDKSGKLKFDENMTYCLDIAFNERQYEAFMYSIHLVEKGHANFAIFPNSSQLISEDEFARKLVDFKRSCKSDPSLMGFDEQQRLAIFSIINGIHGTVPFVLWGPPGTGKTVTLVECVRQLMRRDESYRILICTPSNTAADLIARRILCADVLKPTQMRRYYSLGKNVDERDQALDEIIKMENCAFYGLYDDRFKIDNYAALLNQNVRLIFSTLACSRYLAEEIREPDFFSHIFIDEAGQSIEPETLIPITRFATQNTRIVLCGDHQQLGPVVKAHFLKQFKSCHLSLIERLMTTMRSENYYSDGRQHVVYLDGRTFCQLTDSYRCHPKIIQFSSQNFYAGTLRAVNEQNRRSFCDWKHLPSKNFPIIFHALTKGAEVRQMEGRSYHNEEEVQVVLKYIQLLKETANIEDEEIGVISPYKQQTFKIRDSLVGTGITVDSVECYQGSERRVIILTLSRSKQIGFLSEFKRLNTSLTRAKELIIVIASLDFVRNLNPYRSKNYWIDFIKYCIDNKAVLVDGFAGDSDFSDGILTKNVGIIRRCLKENFNADFTRIERKKRPEFPNILPPIQNRQSLGSVSNSSTSESDDEDEGTVSDLSPLSCSSDEEGHRFWAKQITWHKSEKGMLGTNLRVSTEEMALANAMKSLKVTSNDNEGIEYEDLTKRAEWREEDEQNDGYDLWKCPPGPSGTLNEATQHGCTTTATQHGCTITAQRGCTTTNEMGNAKVTIQLGKNTMNNTAKRRVGPSAHCQRTSRIPEGIVRDDQSRHRLRTAQPNELTAEIATPVEEGNFRASRANIPRGNEQNCRFM